MIEVGFVDAMRRTIVVRFTKTSDNPEIQAIYDASRALLQEVSQLPSSSAETSHDLVTRISRQYSWSAAQGALVYLLDKGLLRVDSRRHVSLAASSQG